MQRRQFVYTSLLTGAAALFTLKKSFAAPSQDVSHRASFKNPQVAEKIAAVQQTIQDCLKKGETCRKHCEDRLAAGDSIFEKCLFNVQQMLLLCDVTGKLAAIQSPLLPQTLNSCISSLESCRDACLEHKAHFAHGMHLECKACAEACAQCLTACNQLKTALSNTSA
jgi:Cys-rich four helix bundle protein (predicted Tat secretion target)